MPIFNFTNEDKSEIIKIARDTLKSIFSSSIIDEKDSVIRNDALTMKCGAFVSLYKNNNLRGCIGQLTSNEPLHITVANMTRAASLKDHRFSPIQFDEIEAIKIEISILSPLEKITHPNEIELGKHGIYIKSNFNSGTYLPQVALKTNWSQEDFVSNCSKYKAGIGRDGWKSAELYRYEVIIINE